MQVAPTLAHEACGTCASHTNCTDAQYQSVDETTTSNRECELKECTACQHGTMATGAACLELDGGHGGTTCAQCNKGYHMNNGACVANTCTCANGAESRIGNACKRAGFVAMRQAKSGGPFL